MRGRVVLWGHRRHDRSPQRTGILRIALEWDTRALAEARRIAREFDESMRRIGRTVKTPPNCLGAAECSCPICLAAQIRKYAPEQVRKALDDHAGSNQPAVISGRAVPQGRPGAAKSGVVPQGAVQESSSHRSAPLPPDTTGGSATGDSSGRAAPVSASEGEGRA